MVWVAHDIKEGFNFIECYNSLEVMFFFKKVTITWMYTVVFIDKTENSDLF